METAPASASAPVSRTRFLHAFRHRDFRLLWTGQTVSLIGDAAFLTALGWKTFTIAGSGKLGLVLSVQAVGLLTTLLIGGALADRYARRKLMVLSDLWRFGAVGALALLDATGTWGFVAASARAADGPRRRLLLPGGRRDGAARRRRRAPAVREQPDGRRALGQLHRRALARGLPLPGRRLGWVFALDALTFVLSAALMVLARPRYTQPSERQGTFREIVEGGRYVAGVPWLWVTITLFAVVLMLQLAPQQVLMPKLVHDHFGGSVGAYGLLMRLVGVGTVTGTLLFGQLQPRRRRGVVTYVLFFVNSLAIAAMALSPWYGLAGLMCVLRGLCIGFGVAVWETMLQELVPEQLLARVVSLDFFGSFGLMPVGLAIWGALAGIAAPGPSIALGALVSAGMIGVALTRPWLREVD